MCETWPINQHKLEYDQEFERNLLDPSSSWDICLSRITDLDSCENPTCLSGSDKRRRVTWTKTSEYQGTMDHILWRVDLRTRYQGVPHMPLTKYFTHSRD